MELVPGQRRRRAPLPDHVVPNGVLGHPGPHRRSPAPVPDLPDPERPAVPVHGRGREQGRLVDSRAPRSAIAVSAGRPLNAPVGPGLGGRHPEHAHPGRLGERQRRRHRPLRVRHQRQRQLETAAGRRPPHRPQQRHRLPVPGAGREQRGPRSRPAAPATRSDPTAAPPRRTCPRSVSGRTIDWTWTASNGNGRAIDHYEYSLDGGGWQNTAGRSFSGQFGYDESHTLRVRAVSDRRGPDPPGQWDRLRERPDGAAPAAPDDDDAAPAADGGGLQHRLHAVRRATRARPAPATTCGAPTCPPAERSRTYCQFRTGTGGAWGPAQYPHAAYHRRQRVVHGRQQLPRRASTPTCATRCGSAAMAPTTPIPSPGDPDRALGGAAPDPSAQTL